MTKPTIVASPGTGLVRHTFKVVVLSQAHIGNVGDWSLAQIAAEGDTGDVVVHVEEERCEELTHQEMAKALTDAESDPGFLLGNQGWVYSLVPGDAITVGGYTGAVQAIVFSKDGENASVQFNDGNLVCCSVEEIS